MKMICLDLEGVLVPEIWVNVAQHTGIDELKVTTREISDYDELMRLRLGILDQHQLTLPDIQNVIAQLTPLPGAIEFIQWLRETYQWVILSDTYYEFAHPLMRQLDWPTLLCHTLEVDPQTQRITGYRLRQKDPKREAVKAFHQLKYQVIAAGDSYNDTSMLSEADAGILFHAPDKVKQEFPQFLAVDTYDELKQAIIRAAAQL